MPLDPFGFNALVPNQNALTNNPFLPGARLPMPGQSNNPFLPPDPQQSSGAVAPPLDPAEEESILSKIGSSTLSGLATVGNILDTPGSIVRGLLSGDPGRALSGILDPSKRVRGADLLGLPEDTSLFSPEGVAGLGVEIGLDPLTYLTLGSSAVNKLGQTAKKVGVLPKTLTGRLSGLAEGTTELEKLAQATGRPAAELASQPLGSVARFAGIPIGEGQAGLNFLNSPAGAPLRVLGNVTEPIRRYGRALFDASVQGSTSKEVQPFAEAAFHAAKQSTPQELLGQIGVMRQLEQQGLLGDSKLLVPFAEQVNQEHLPQAVRDALVSLQPAQRQALEQAGVGVGATMQRILGEAKDLGLNSPELVDRFIEQYLPRHARAPASATKALVSAKQQVLPTFGASMLERTDAFRDIPGGTSALEDLLGNQALKTGASVEDTAKTIREQYLWKGANVEPVNRLEDPLDIMGARLSPRSMDDALVERMNYLKKNTSDQETLNSASQEIADIKKQLVSISAMQPNVSPDRYRQLMDPLESRLSAIEPIYQEELIKHTDLKLLQGVYDQSFNLAQIAQKVAPGAGGFFNEPFKDIMNRLAYHARSVANADALHDLFVEYAHAPELAAGNLAYQAPKGYVSLNTAYANTNMGKFVGDGIPKANQEALDQFASRFAEKYGQTVDPAKVMVPKNVADDAARMMKVLQAPEAAKPFIDAFDKMTALTKWGMIGPWPGTKVRNFLTDAFQNWVTGHFSPGSYKDAMDLHLGNVIQGAADFPAFKGLGLTDEEATRKIADYGLAHGLLGQSNIWNDLPGASGNLIENQGAKAFLPGPGARQATPFEVAGQGIKDTLGGLTGAFQGGAAGQEARAAINPLAMTGVGAENTFAPARASRQIDQIVSDTGMMSGFIDMLKNGYAPEAAAMESKVIHFDYQSMTPFERSFMRRIVPFYGWIRHNVPFVVEQILENPGGRMAQSVRAGAAARGHDEGFLPSYLGEGVVAKIGSPDETGTQKFLGGLGLPFEDLGQLTNPGQMALSSLSPLVKAPLELATGKQFYSGRELKDLVPYTGSTLADELIFNSPLARAVRFGRQAVDPRKSLTDLAVNMLSGAHVTDVDMERAKDVAVRDFIQDNLRGDPNVKWFQEPYVRREDVAKLTPDQLLLLRLQATRAKAARDRLQTMRNAG